MQTETYDDILRWTSELHDIIADQLAQALTPETDQRSRWLMEYVASHERELAGTVRRYREQAGKSASRTWLYEHIGEDVPPNSRWELTFADKSFDQISRQIFDLHAQLVEVYTSMSGRAPIPAAVELMNNMLTLEQGATRRLAEQCGRLNDL